MKRVILVGFIVLVLSLPAAGIAATAGSPETTGEAGRVSLSFEYDGVFGRDMKFKSGTKTDNTGISLVPLPGESFEDWEFGSNRYFLKATVGAHETVDLYIKLGTADAKSEFIWAPYYDEKNKWDVDYGFAYGAGFKAKVLGEKEGLMVGVSGDYLRYKADGRWSKVGVDISDPSSLGVPYKMETTIDEWQLAVSGGYKMAKLTPYGGLKYSDISLKNELKYTDPIDGPTTLTMKANADKNIGVFAGIDIGITDNFGVNLEGRFLDETAGTVAAVYKF